MESFPWIDLDYCCYCNWFYRKRTRLWNNVNFPAELGPGEAIAQIWATAGTTQQSNRAETDVKPDCMEHILPKIPFIKFSKICVTK